MGFENLNTDGGVATLNTFLADKSYIEGHTASQADVAVYETLASAPAPAKFPHAARWFSHISAHKTSFAQYAHCIRWG